jgi:heptosyltransferase-2
MSRSGRQRDRVLVVLPNWLGDLIMAMPMLDLLHRARDRAGRQLTLIASVRRRWAPLLSRDPRLAGLISYERTGSHAGLRGSGRLAAAWRRVDADAVVICPPSLRMAALAWLARIPCRVGERRDARRLLLTLPLAPVQPRGSLHYSDEMRRLGSALLEVLGCPAPAGTDAAPRLPGLANLTPAALGAGPPLWILAPGATFGPAKSWPVARMADFLRLAIQTENVRVAVVGDASATTCVDALRRQANDLPWRRETRGPAGVVDLVGCTTLIDLAALMRSAAAFVGNDSGTMHLAAALGVPTLGLFGSSSADWTGPLGRQARAITASGFSCQPCFRKTCNRAVFCLETLTGLEVLGELKKLLAGTGQPPRS